MVNPSASFTQLVQELPAIESKNRVVIQIEQLIAKLQRKKQYTNINAETFRFNSGGTDLESLIINLKNDDAFESMKIIQQMPGLWKYLDELKPPPPYQLYSDHPDQFRETQRGYGKATKPEDYISNFTEYLKNNINQIAALKLISTAPRELSRKALKELLLQLDQQGYNASTLHAAWLASKHQDVAADIIAYIRTLMMGNTLVSKEERIKNAMAKIKAQKQWNKTQINWLERIEKQLLAETILTKADLDSAPFSDAGGFTRLDKIFENQLSQLLDQMNEYLYENQTA